MHVFESQEGPSKINGNTTLKNLGTEAFKNFGIEVFIKVKISTFRGFKNLLL